MHIISEKMLRDSWGRHPGSEGALRAWHRAVEQTVWENFGDVRATYAHADQVGKFTVFNIGGNKYRLIAVIHFNRQKVFVRHVLTHEEYDRDDWKSD
jgi:mRNA interferase HigB